MRISLHPALGQDFTPSSTARRVQASLVEHPLRHLPSLAAIVAAILLTMIATYLFLAYANTILGRIGQRGIDAATRIVGFFVAAMGMGLIFHGVTQAIRDYVMTGKP